MLAIDYQFVAYHTLQNSVIKIHLRRDESSNSKWNDNFASCDLPIDNSDVTLHLNV